MGNNQKNHGVLRAIRNASIKEFQIDGISYRVRRVSSADIAKVGFAWLSMATPKDGETINDLDMQKLLERADEGKLIQLAKLKDAMIAAGLIAIGVDNVWDDCRVTLKQSEEDTENGVIWVGSIPSNADADLFTEIMNLSSDTGNGGNAGEILASFRATTGNVDSVGRDCAPLRENAG